MIKKITSQIATVFSIMLFTACSSEDSDLSTPFLDIPDERFEQLLIDKGIDTDGMVNQQMLKEDALPVSALILERSGGASEIKDLTGIEGFINLTYLSATSHDISTVDLRGNILLDTIYLAGNFITSLDLSNNSNLILLDVAANSLNSISGLSSSKDLKQVDLSFNNLTELTINNESIEVMYVGDNLLTQVDVGAAINLKNVYLKSNQLTSIDLGTNTLLETLVLSDNQIEQVDLNHNTNLTHLFISSNSLEQLDVSALQELVHLTVHNNPTLACIKIESDQNIPTVTKTGNQELSNVCD